MMLRKCIFNYLTVGCWNIEGIHENINSVKISKLEQPFFQEILNKHDILCLQETHISQDEPIPTIAGYDVIPHCRQISANNRYFGGMLVFTKSCIKKGIKLGLNIDEDAIEVTLSKNFFGLRRDVKILFTYASPLNSPYTIAKPENMIEKIETRYVEEYGKYIIMGDLNHKLTNS